MALQAERDHLQFKMRETVAAAVSASRASTHRGGGSGVKSDDSDDDDPDELKETLAAKTEEARKLKTLVDQLTELVNEKAPDLAKEADNKSVTR